jgi:hypothetical protein
MAYTGLAVLAFQAAGHYGFNQRLYSGNVSAALQWMVQNQRAEGALFGSLNRDGWLHPDAMYEHGIATLALAEACGLAKASGRAPEEAWAEAATRAVWYLVQHQHDDGGWRYSHDRQAPSDTSVSGWAALALMTAAEAGIAVDENCVQALAAFYRLCETGERGRTCYMVGRGVGTEATTGMGMLVHQLLLRQPDSVLVDDAARHLSAWAEQEWAGSPPNDGEKDFYLWHCCTTAMVHAGGAVWERWNASLRERIVALQEQQGCARGSWSPEGSAYGRGKYGAGRIYTTALAVLTLEAYYRYGL